MAHSAERRHVHDPDSKPQQPAAAAGFSAPVKSCTADVFAGCPTTSIQSETLNSGAEVEEEADASQTAPLAHDRVLMLRNKPL